jgi:hypothetical protein
LTEEANGQCDVAALPADARLENEFPAVSEAKRVVWIVAERGEMTVEVNTPSKSGETFGLGVADCMPVNGAPPRREVGPKRVGCAVWNFAAKR